MDTIVDKFTEGDQDLIVIGHEDGKYFLETTGLKSFSADMAGKVTRTYTKDRKQAEEVFARLRDTMATCFAYRRKE